MRERALGPPVLSLRKILSLRIILGSLGLLADLVASLRRRKRCFFVFVFQDKGLSSRHQIGSGSFSLAATSEGRARAISISSSCVDVRLFIIPVMAHVNLRRTWNVDGTLMGPHDDSTFRRRLENDRRGKAHHRLSRCQVAGPGPGVGKNRVVSFGGNFWDMI